MIDGLLVVGDDAGELTALDASTGEVSWNKTLKGPIRSKIVSDDHHAYVMDDGGYPAQGYWSKR